MAFLKASAAPSDDGRKGSKRFFPLSIRTHLTLIAIILTMGPVVIFGLVQALSVRDREITAASSRYNAMATSVAREIDFFVTDAADNLTLLAGVIAEKKRFRAETLEAQVRRALDTRTIDHITVMTPSARSIVNLNRDQRLPTGVDYSDRPYIRAMIASRAPQLSAPLIGRVTGRVEIFLGVPAFDRRGAIKAILVGALDMTELYKRHLSEPGTAEPLGRTLLLEPSGRPVAASDRTIAEVFASSANVRIAQHIWESDPRLLAWTDTGTSYGGGQRLPRDMEVDDLARGPGEHPPRDHGPTDPAIGLHGPLAARGLSDPKPARVSHHGPADPGPEAPSQAPRRRGAGAAGHSAALSPK